MVPQVIEFDNEWLTIEAAMDKVVYFVDSGLTHGDIGQLCTDAELLCIHNATSNLGSRYTNSKIGEQLYGHSEAFFQNYLRTKILPALSGKNGEILLREVAKRWKGYKFIMHWMSLFCQWIDRSFLHPNKTSSMLNNVINSLQKLIYEEMKGQIISTILSLIDKDREGNSVDRVLIKEVLETVYDLQPEILSEPYQTDFEPALLNSSNAYYLHKSLKSTLGIPDSSDISYSLDWNAIMLRLLCRVRKASREAVKGAHLLANAMCKGTPVLSDGENGALPPCFLFENARVSNSSN